MFQNGTFMHHRIYDACYLNVFSKALMFRRYSQEPWSSKDSAFYVDTTPLEMDRSHSRIFTEIWITTTQSH